MDMFSDKQALLLDMNGTFMFGEDRFGMSEDYSIHYLQLGGDLSKSKINKIIKLVYSYLDERYSDVRYRHNFPTIEDAINNIGLKDIDPDEISKVIDTFSYHEIGYIPTEYIEALNVLNQHYRLAVVIDIWSPKSSWLKLFEVTGIDQLFSAASFSSDHGMVKPSSKPFQLVLNQLGINNTQALVIGDSIRRDLGGATEAGIECVLVGGAKHSDALASYRDLLEISCLMKNPN